MKKSKVKTITKLVRIGGVTPFFLKYKEGEDMMEAIRKRVPFDGLWTKTGKCRRSVRVADWNDEGFTIGDMIKLLMQSKNKKKKFHVERFGSEYLTKGCFVNEDGSITMAYGQFAGDVS